MSNSLALNAIKLLKKVTYKNHEIGRRQGRKEINIIIQCKIKVQKVKKRIKQSYNVKH